METVFFLASKLIWAAIKPESWLMLALVLGLMALWRGRLRCARRLLGAALIGFGTIGALPLGDLLLRPLETRFVPPAEMPAEITGIVVLGGAEAAGLSAHWGQPVANDGAERLLATAALARRYPAARVIFTGGSGALFPAGLTEAEVAADLLEQAGLRRNRVEFEDQARNTAENAARAHALAAPASTDTWLLVTSAAHMPRAMGAFCARGWPITPYPVDPRSQPFAPAWDLAAHLDQLNSALREWVGLAAYRATGRTTALLPQGC